MNIYICITSARHPLPQLMGEEASPSTYTHTPTHIPVYVHAIRLIPFHTRFACPHRCLGKQGMWEPCVCVSCVVLPRACPPHDVPFL